MSARNYAWRRAKRLTKGTRRIKEDRAQHGSDHRCACFNPDGRTFARFADYPKTCSGPCCGNPRRWFGTVTMQERRAAIGRDGGET